MTVTPALGQLVDQVLAANPEAEVEYGKKDGIGFVRSATFDAKVSKALNAALEVIADPRIASLGIKAKRLTVTFVEDVRADHRTPFPIEVVDAILSE